MASLSYYFFTVKIAHDFFLLDFNSYCGRVWCFHNFSKIQNLHSHHLL